MAKHRKVHSTELDGDVDHENSMEPTELPRGRKQTLSDSWGDGEILYKISVGM